MYLSGQDRHRVPLVLLQHRQHGSTVSTAAPAAPAAERRASIRAQYAPEPPTTARKVFQRISRSIASDQLST